MTPLPTTAPNTISDVVDVAEGWKITGWVGAVDEQKNIDEETNVVPVLAWGKLIHEDLLSAVKPAGVFAKYLMGELQADFVDQDGLDDIATSDRQSLKETDQRYEALRRPLRTCSARWGTHGATAAATTPRQGAQEPCGGGVVQLAEG
jgi:hypothetical protein